MYISNINTASIRLENIELDRISEGSPKTIHSHDHLTILYLAKGAATCSHHDTRDNIKKKDLIILNPNQQVTIDPIRKIEYIQLDITGVVFISSSKIEGDHGVFVVADEGQMIKYYLDLALLESKNGFRGSDIILRKLTECVLAHILRHHNLSIKDSSIQVKHEEIEEIKEHIRQNFNRKVSLDELSELVDINKYYLIRLFKQQTGLSPIDYLIHLRLAEAERLLTSTDTNIAEISNYVGFHSASHFSKTFKEANGLTPSAYRRKFSRIGFNN